MRWPPFALGGSGRARTSAPADARAVRVSSRSSASRIQPRGVLRRRARPRRRCAHRGLGGDRDVGELELVAAAHAHRVVELDDLAAARALAPQLLVVPAVEDRRQQPMNGTQNETRNHIKNELPFDPADDAAGQAEEEQDHEQRRCRPSGRRLPDDRLQRPEHRHDHGDHDDDPEDRHHEPDDDFRWPARPRRSARDRRAPCERSAYEGGMPSIVDIPYPSVRQRRRLAGSRRRARALSRRLRLRCSKSRVRHPAGGGPRAATERAGSDAPGRAAPVKRARRRSATSRTLESVVGTGHGQQ